MKAKIEERKSIMHWAVGIIFGIVTITGVSMFLALKGVLDVGIIISSTGDSFFEKIHMIAGMALVVLGSLHIIVEYTDSGD